MMSSDAEGPGQYVHGIALDRIEHLLRVHIANIRGGGPGSSKMFLDRVLVHSGIYPTAKLMKSLTETRLVAEMSESSAELFQHLGRLEIADNFIKDAIADTLDIRNRVARSWFFRKRRLRQVDEHLARLVAWRLRLNK